MSSAGPLSDQLEYVRVMIVDDHEIVRHAVRGIFNMTERFKVVAEARASDEALELFRTNPVDLVLLDLSLQDGNALHVIHEIRQIQNTSAVIVFSAALTDETLLQAVIVGASGYITKDTPLADIITLLQNYKPGEFVMPSPIMARLLHLLIERHQTLSMQNNMLDAQVRQLTQTDAIKQPSATSKAQHTQVFPLPMHVLTPQEEKIFQLMRRGDSNKQIAVQLSISRFTVGKHVQNILRKLGAINRTQAVSYTAFEGEENG